MKLLLLALLCTFSFIVCATENSVDDIVKNIYDPNPKIVNAVKGTIKAMDALVANKDEVSNFDLMKSFLESSLCIASFQQEMMEAKYIGLSTLMSHRMAGGKESVMATMSKIKKSKELSAALNAHMDKISKQPRESWCTTDSSVVKTADGSNSISNTYNAIMKLKKIAHPDFVTLLNSPVHKSQLDKNLPKPMTDEEYQKQYLNAFYTYGQLLEMESLQNLKDFKKNCTVAEDYYDKNCKDQEKYNSIPFKGIREYYCVKDLIQDNPKTKDPNCKKNNRE